MTVSSNAKPPPSVPRAELSSTPNQKTAIIKATIEGGWRIKVLGPKLVVYTGVGRNATVLHIRDPLPFITVTLIINCSRISNPIETGDVPPHSSAE